MQETATHPGPFEGSVIGQLSTLDRFLPVWIGLAMAFGLALGRVFPGLNDQLDRVKIDTTSLPIAIGLLGMMYPVLAKVRYERLRSVTADRPLVLSSLLLNWVVGPALMFALAWIFLSDLPEFRTGLILIGLARCIAMVLIWNTLACGDAEAGAVLVVLNSVFQVAAYALLGYFYLELLPGWLGLDKTSVDFVLWDIAKSVLIFLGVPLVLGFLTSVIGRCRRAISGTSGNSFPELGRGHSTASSLPSSSSSPSRAMPLPRNRLTWPESRYPWSSTSPSCGHRRSPGAECKGCRTRRPQHLRSRLLGTTSSWR